MTISFNSIPSSGLLTPFFAAEINNTNAGAGPSEKVYRALLIGQKTSSGSAAANSLTRVFSANQVALLAGRGSQLHRMALAWFADNKFTEVWVGVLADNGAGVAAAGNVAITGTATAAGTLQLYIGGEVVSLGVAVGDTGASLATKLAALLPSASDFPVTGAVNGSITTQVDVTCRHKGAAGNEIDLRMNYQDGDATPAGLTVTVTPMASGATNPTLTTLISTMGDTQFDVCAHPYTDSTSLTALEVEFKDRFGPTRMIDGALFAAKSDTLSNLATLGNGRNSAQSTIVGLVSFPTAPYEVAANTAALVAYYGAQDPARPFQTLASSWVKPPVQADLLQWSERNALLQDGVATLVVGPGGQVQIERLVTTYKTNSLGAPDTSYRDVNTLLTLSYIRYDFRNLIRTKYPRHKLANDGTQFGRGQAVVTPSSLKAECLHWYDDMQEKGLVENAAAFKAALVVERDATDRNRVNFLLPPDLINQFVVGAAAINFVL